MCVWVCVCVFVCLSVYMCVSICRCVYVVFVYLCDGGVYAIYLKNVHGPERMDCMLMCCMNCWFCC